MLNTMICATQNKNPRAAPGPHPNSTSIFSILFVPIRFFIECNWKAFILRSWVTWVFTHTRVSRRERVEAALPVGPSIFMSRDRLLLIVDSKYLNSSTTSNSDGKAIHQRCDGLCAATAASSANSIVFFTFVF